LRCTTNRGVIGSDQVRPVQPATGLDVGVGLGADVALGGAVGLGADVGVGVGVVLGATAVAVDSGESLTTAPGPPPERTMKATAATAITATAIVDSSRCGENRIRLAASISPCEDADIGLPPQAPSRGTTARYAHG
jgi:hypothetical protein